MTEKRLEELWGGNKIGFDHALTPDQIDELVKEIRRCWKVIEDMEQSVMVMGEPFRGEKP